MDEKKTPASKDTGEALKEFLRMIAEHPEMIDRMTFTIRPAKLTQQKPGK